MQDSKLFKSANVTFHPKESFDFVGGLENVDLGDENGDDTPAEGPSMEMPNKVQLEPQSSLPATIPSKSSSSQGGRRRSSRLVKLLGSTTRVNCSVRQRGVRPVQATFKRHYSKDSVTTHSTRWGLQAK